jgi:hypothetical protein
MHVHARACCVWNDPEGQLQNSIFRNEGQCHLLKFGPEFKFRNFAERLVVAILRHYSVSFGNLRITLFFEENFDSAVRRNTASPIGFAL